MFFSGSSTRELDVLVDLVDAGVGRAELDHLRADRGDEAPVRGAAGGREFGAHARSRRGSPRASASDSSPRSVRNGIPDSDQSIAVVQAVAVEDAVTRCLQALDRAGGGKAEVEVEPPARPGMTLVAPGAGVEVGHLPGRRRKVLVAVDPSRSRPVPPAPARAGGPGCAPGADRRRGPAAPLHHQPSRQRAAAAVLDRVAERCDRGRLADDAVVEPLAARGAAAPPPSPCRRWPGLPRRR